MMRPLSLFFMSVLLFMSLVFNFAQNVKGGSKLSNARRQNPQASVMKDMIGVKSHLLATGLTRRYNPQICCAFLYPFVLYRIVQHRWQFSRNLPYAKIPGHQYHIGPIEECISGSCGYNTNSPVGTNSCSFDSRA
jgi:hypothetical protein